MIGLLNWDAKSVWQVIQLSNSWLLSLYYSHPNEEILLVLQQVVMQTSSTIPLRKCISIQVNNQSDPCSPFFCFNAFSEEVTDSIVEPSPKCTFNSWLFLT